MKTYKIVYWILSPILLSGAVTTYVFKDERFAIGSAVLTTIAMYSIISITNLMKKKTQNEEHKSERSSQVYSKEKKKFKNYWKNTVTFP